MNAPPLSSLNPSAAYGARLDARRVRAKSLRRRESRIGNLRLGVFAAGAALAAWVIHGGVAGSWLALPAALFLLLIILHDKAIAARKQADRAVSFYEAGVRRLSDTWAGTGIQEAATLDPSELQTHPFAGDMDVFGQGSLFELLCTCRTRIGQHTLAQWLLAPASPEEIAGRRQSIVELSPNIDLREQVAVTGEQVDSSLRPQTLIDWGTSAAVFKSPIKRRLFASVALALTAASIISVLGWALGGFGPVPFLIVVLLQWGFGRALRDRVGRIVVALEQPREELLLIAEILRLIERQPLQSPRLLALHDTLKTEKLAAWQAIRRLGKLADLLDARRNQFFVPIGFLLHWSLQFGLLIENWRLRHGPRLGDWLAAIGEFEALAALANFSYENPSYPFAEVLSGPPRIDGEQLGHPLLPRDACVTNDICLAMHTDNSGHQQPRLLIISGSNMSGKSTFLRTVGSNIVLALAGAPVRAKSLALTPVQIGATLRVQDSLQEGASRFYAEIKRLRQLVDLSSGRLPLFFLLDEILHGTNSHDRRIGAAAIIEGLLQKPCLGLVTTHDLALAQMIDTLGCMAKNVHFQDTLENGQLHFDYRMQEGVVTKSNALALMRAVGLDVPSPAASAAKKD